MCHPSCLHSFCVPPHQMLISVPRLSRRSPCCWFSRSLLLTEALCVCVAVHVCVCRSAHSHLCVPLEDFLWCCDMDAGVCCHCSSCVALPPLLLPYCRDFGNCTHAHTQTHTFGKKHTYYVGFLS